MRHRRAFLLRPLSRSTITSSLWSLLTLVVLNACTAAGDSVTAPVGTTPGTGVPALVDVSTTAVALGGVGSVETVIATIRDANGRTIAAPTVNWSSENTNVVEVAGGGVSATMVARGPGSTRVKAMSGNAATYLDVRVLGVRAISISPTNVGVRLGDAAPLKATVDGDAGAVQSVKWATLNPSIATIDASGIVTGVGVGTTSVRASATADPTVVATAIVTVAPARTVQLAPGLSAITMWVGDSKTVPAQADVDSTQSRGLAWSVDNTAIASVDANGNVTALSAGTSIIRVVAIADPRARAELLLTVLPARKVTVAPASVNVGVQQQTTLTATVSIELGFSTAVRWSTSDNTVATVSQDGIVTGINLGAATITATSLSDTLRKGTAVVIVSPSVRQVVVTPATLTTSVGDQTTLVADVITDGPLPRTTTWRTSNPTIATVSATGVVSSLGVGTATITALSTVDSTKRGTAQVTVQPAPVVGISPSSVSLAVGETRTLTGRITVAPGVSAAATWRTSDAQIATVDANGTVTGQGLGNATITMISVADSTRRATASVSVIPIVRSITVSPSSASGFAGDVIQLTATIVADGALSKVATWRTSNPAIANVNTNGTVTLSGVGQATITALATADTTKRASVVIAVGAPSVRSVSLTPTSAGLGVGQSTQLTTTVIADGSLSTAYLLRSSNPAVATVGGTGIVTGVSVGSTVITALSAVDSTKRATAVITVSARAIVVTIAPRPVSLTSGQSQQLQATVTADPGVITSVNWSSSASNVVTINSTGFISALTPGSALISAISVADPTKRDTMTVTVASNQLATSWSSTRLGGALYEDVVSTVGFGASSAFAVNVTGDVYRWDGTSWTLSTRASSFGGQFLAVHGSSASNVIAVGTNGIVARFDGSSWSGMSSGTTGTLKDVWVEASGVAYAVGANGLALRLSGSSWSATSTGSSQTLNGVWSTSGTVFAVGNNGEILSYNGSSWTRDTSPSGESFYSVSGSSASNVVAVGTSGVIVRFDGSTWAIVANSITTSDLYGVSGSSANNGRMYIVSDVGLLQLDGASLNAVSTPYRPVLYSVSTDAAGTVWIGGQRGAVMRFNGSWTTTSLNPDLLDVWSTSSTNAWAVGEFGVVYRYNGAAWARQTTPTTLTLNTVWGASSTDAFAGGENGTLLRFTGGAWSTMSSPTTATINAMWGASSTDVYAVTGSGQILRFNGTSWSIAATIASPLWGVYGVASGEVYATGENGALFRFNGTGWTSLSPTGSGTLVGMWGSANNSLMTVGVDASGFSGVAYRYNGSAWSTQSLGTSRALTSVWGPSNTDVYVAGDQGTMLRFNGTSWQSMATGTTELLWSVTGSPTGSGGAFAVGYNSTLVTGAGNGPFIAASTRGAVRSSLEPSPLARGSHGAPLPTGSARRLRKSRIASATRSGSTPASAPASIKFRGHVSR